MGPGARAQIYAQKLTTGLDQKPGESGNLDLNVKFKMDLQTTPETEEDELPWWQQDEIREADYSFNLSLEEFTAEFISLILKLLDSDAEKRPKIDLLCDHKLYYYMSQLQDYNKVIIGCCMDLPQDVYVDLVVRLGRKVAGNNISREELYQLRDGYLADKLREALGYDLSVEMADEIARRDVFDFFGVEYDD